jgi:methionyl aminopeptidase
MPDHWTQVTLDGRPSAHFEHTLAITPEGPLALTSGPNGEMDLTLSAREVAMATASPAG